MGAVSVTPSASGGGGPGFQIAGAQRKQTGTLSLSSSYATGGDTFTAANFGLDAVDDLLLEQGTSGFIFKVDLTNSKIKAFGQTPTSVTAGTIALDEAAAATNLSAIVVNYLVFGV